jgi:pimeloyl-ACP methyl ester carboxylesterase
LIPGMTAEYPVFSRLLPLLPNATVVNFIPPEEGESLVDYAARMAAQFPRESYIVGVSFGGIVALEVSRIVRPHGCILISSIRSPNQLPPWLRLWRTLGGRNSARMLRAAGQCAGLIPRSICTHATLRVRQLAGAEGSWHCWATSTVLDWRPDPAPFVFPLLQIHGAEDATFPLRYVQPDVVVPGGRHALPVTHPQEVARAILTFCERELVTST